MIFRDRNVSFLISFNREVNIHFLLFLFQKYANKRQSAINLSKLFSKNMNVEINAETIYKDKSLYSKIITETRLGFFVKAIANLCDSLRRSQQEAANEIEAFFMD